MAGMALGTGSALAHRAVDSVLGSRHPEPAQAQARTRAGPELFGSGAGSRALCKTAGIWCLEMRLCLGKASYWGVFL